MNTFKSIVLSIITVCIMVSPLTVLATPDIQSSSVSQTESQLNFDVSGYDVSGLKSFTQSGYDNWHKNDEYVRYYKITYIISPDEIEESFDYGNAAKNVGGVVLLGAVYTGKALLWMMVMGLGGL